MFASSSGTLGYLSRCGSTRHCGPKLGHRLPRQQGAPHGSRSPPISRTNKRRVIHRMHSGSFAPAVALPAIPSPEPPAARPTNTSRCGAPPHRRHMRSASAKEANAQSGDHLNRNGRAADRPRAGPDPILTPGVQIPQIPSRAFEFEASTPHRIPSWTRRFDRRGTSSSHRGRRTNCCQLTTSPLVRTRPTGWRRRGRAGGRRRRTLDHGRHRIDALTMDRSKE